MDNLDSRGWLAYFMKGTTRHYNILYAVALMVIDKKIFKGFFSNYMSMRAIDPQGHGHFAPKKM